MTWTQEDQARLDALRERELAGTLSELERAELDRLVARVEADEAELLGSGLARMRVQVGEMEQAVRSLQRDNEQLARVIARK